MVMEVLDVPNGTYLYVAVYTYLRTCAREKTLNANRIRDII